MFENGLSTQESFLWGVMTGTLAWMCLSAISVLVLGFLIRRSSGETPPDEIEPGASSHVGHAPVVARVLARVPRGR